MRGDQYSANAVGREDSRIGGETAPRIDYDPYRLRPGDPPHSQQWIVRDGRADTDDNAVHQRPQPVKMREARRPVYIFGMACFRSNAAIKRLSELTDNHEIIHHAFPQRPEHLAPRLR